MHRSFTANEAEQKRGRQSVRALVAAALASAFLAGPVLPARAEADGPDYFRVIGVASGKALNIRAEPAASSRVLGTIPADANGLRNLGCRGGLTFAEREKASEQERSASRYRRWCRVDYRGTTGWVAGRFVGEGGPL